MAEWFTYFVALADLDRERDVDLDIDDLFSSAVMHFYWLSTVYSRT